MCIQWGPIGDVGIVAEQLLATEEKADMMKLFSGISLQRITSCLEVFDRLMQCPSAVLSSIIKRDMEQTELQSEDEMIRQLCNALSIDKHNDEDTLGEIGLDSMMAVEIQQRLERDYEITLTLNDIKKIKVGELKEFRDGNRDRLKQYAIDIKKARTNMDNIRFEHQTEPTTLLNDVKTGN